MCTIFARVTLGWVGLRCGDRVVTLELAERLVECLASSLLTEVERSLATLVVAGEVAVGELGGGAELVEASAGSCRRVALDDRVSEHTRGGSLVQVGDVAGPECHLGLLLVEVQLVELGLGDDVGRRGGSLGGGTLLLLALLGATLRVHLLGGLALAGTCTVGGAVVVSHDNPLWKVHVRGY